MNKYAIIFEGDEVQVDERINLEDRLLDQLYDWISTQVEYLVCEGNPTFMERYPEAFKNKDTWEYEFKLTPEFVESFLNELDSHEEYYGDNYIDFTVIKSSVKGFIEYMHLEEIIQTIKSELREFVEYPTLKNIYKII